MEEWKEEYERLLMLFRLPKNWRRVVVEGREGKGRAGL